MDYNVNFNQCFKPIRNIGETVWSNVCNGSTVHVPWGTVDYITFLMGVLFISAVVGFIATDIYCTWKDGR